MRAKHERVTEERTYSGTDRHKKWGKRSNIEMLSIEGIEAKMYGKILPTNPNLNRINIKIKLDNWIRLVLIIKKPQRNVHVHAYM